MAMVSMAAPMRAATPSLSTQQCAGQATSDGPKEVEAAVTSALLSIRAVVRRRRREVLLLVPAIAVLRRRCEIVLGMMAVTVRILLMLLMLLLLLLPPLFVDLMLNLVRDGGAHHGTNDTAHLAARDLVPDEASGAGAGHRRDEALRTVVAVAASSRYLVTAAGAAEAPSPAARERAGAAPASAAAAV